MLNFYAAFFLLVLSISKLGFSRDPKDHELWKIASGISSDAYCEPSKNEFQRTLAEINPHFVGDGFYQDTEIQKQVQEWIDSFHSFVKVYSQTKAPPPKVVLTKSFTRNAGIVPISKGQGNDPNQISSYCISNIFFITIGDLARSREENFATLAHELGHYYLAHFFREDDFDYFYDLKTRNHFQIPQANKQTAAMIAFSKALKEKYDEINSYVESLGEGANYINDAIFEEQENEIRVLESKVDEFSWGKYTDEQQADEFAVLLLAVAGMDPIIAPHSYLKLDSVLFMAMKQDKSQIEKMLAAEFKQGQDEWIPNVFIGDSHHSIGFRVYSQYKLIQTFDQLKLKNQTEYGIDEQAWDKMLEPLIKQLSPRQDFFFAQLNPVILRFLKYGAYVLKESHWLYLIESNREAALQLKELGYLQKLSKEEQTKVEKLLNPPKPAQE